MKYSTTLTVIAFAVSLWGCEEKATNEQLVEQTPWGEQIFEVPAFQAREFNIQDYGAKAEAGVNNQSAIQAAIDACAAKGGGKVLVPAGTWETAYLELKSKVNLHLSEGAVLSFLDDIDLYAVPTFTRWEGLECMNYHPFIYARNQEDIALSGQGVIKGNGQAWWDLAKGTQKSSLRKLYDLVEAGVSPEERNCLAFEPTSFLRPSMVQFIGCTHVLVEDIELNSGPMWTTHFVYCSNVVARNLRVITTGTNNDGIVPDSCNGMLIDNCYFSTGDDCIVIKSGLNEDGWRVGKASQYIVIKDCKTKHGHGGVVIGSEMSGGVNHVYAHDCDFGQTERGLRIKSMKGRGGLIEDLWFENIRMDNIRREAIRINMHYGSSSIEPRSDSLPTFRNFHYKDIHSQNSRFAIRVDGIDEHYVDGIYFENLNMDSEEGIWIRNTQNAHFSNLTSKTGAHIPVSLVRVKDLEFDSAHFTSQADTMILADGPVENVRFNTVNNADFNVLTTNDSEETITIN